MSQNLLTQTPWGHLPSPQEIKIIPRSLFFLSTVGHHLSIGPKVSHKYNKKKSFSDENVKHKLIFSQPHSM